MRIGCIYTVDDYETVDKPLSTSSDIPFGLSIIMSVLEQENHVVDLFVITRSTDVDALIGDYIDAHSPGLWCLTAVSSQYPATERVARVIKQHDPESYVLLGGHHASLAPERAIDSPAIDALCVGEGDFAVVEVAKTIGEGKIPSGIPNLWVKQPGTDEIEKTPTDPFNQALDDLPYVNRKLWEPWILAPQDEVSVLVGRGCPFKCTYCSNHALAQISTAKFVRFRSPADMIGEIADVCEYYPDLRHIYLEVETIGASIRKANELFTALADFNEAREEKLSFSMNLAIHTNFTKHEDKTLEFLEQCRRANVVTLNVGLESGSEWLRKEVLRRPKYSNDELVHFTELCKQYGIGTTLYVLLGLPGETPKEFSETVKAVRRINPEMVNLSIFYPYLGTDLYDVALAEGAIPDDLEVQGERRRAELDLVGFSKRRVRQEYIFFWYRAFHGNWPMSRIIAFTFRAYISGHPKMEAAYRWVLNHNHALTKIKRKYTPRGVVSKSLR